MNLTASKYYLAGFFGVLLLFSSAFAHGGKIVLIAGPLDDHAPGTHEYENTALLLKHCLESSPTFAEMRAEVYFNGWPDDAAVLDDADVILLTSGGSDRNETNHPIYVKDRFTQLEKQMKRGCSLVLLHWSTFHPSRFHEQVTEWMGGYFDYETGKGGPTEKWFSEIANREWHVFPSEGGHPINRGVKPFEMTEELYFNLRFREKDARLAPILLKDSASSTQENIVAWAVERGDGGRGFGFTGGHFYTNWWNPEFRKSVLNAVAWTAKLKVPSNGVESSLNNFKPPLSKKLERLSSPDTTVKKVRPANPETDSGKVAKEEAWKDSRWSQTQIGPFLSSSVPTPNGTILKGISIKVGDQGQATVCYDTGLVNLRAAWTGNFLEFDPARFGLINSPKIGGDLQFLAPSKTSWHDQKAVYQGLFLNGKRVVLSYELGDTKILESPWFEQNTFTRTFELGPSQSAQRLNIAELKNARVVATNVNGIRITMLEKDGRSLAVAVVGNAKPVLMFDGDNGSIVLELPPRNTIRDCKLFIADIGEKEVQEFAGRVQKSSAPENLQKLAEAGVSNWNESITTKGQMAFSTEPYVVDTITVPYDNPYKALMFLSGVDFFDNGDAAVCSIHGDVWVVHGIDNKLEKIAWKRFATGLFQPLGLKIVDGKVHVIGRDQITVLFDRNLDGEADFYQKLSNQITTSAGGHDYVTCLETDADGNFYYVDPSGVHRVSRDGKEHKTIATGWRNPNGMSVGPKGIITVAPQEGNWTPVSSICEIKPGDFYGFGGPQISPDRPLGYDAPLCWIPRMIDNSTASQVWVTSEKWGPLKDQMLSLSFGRCSMMLVLREVVNGQPQGGVVSLKPRFLSGAMRGTFREQDGQFYVVGSLGWSTSATKEGSFQRVRYTGKKIHLPIALNILQNGIQLTFSERLDRETAEDVGSYGIEQWNYRYSREYGSKEYSVKFPDEVGHDEVEIKSARLSEDGRSVFLEIPGVRPVMQMRIQYNVNASDGKTVRGEIFNTINVVGQQKGVAFK